MYAHIANIPLADMRLMNDLRNFGGPKSFLCAAVAAAVRLCLARLLPFLLRDGWSGFSAYVGVCLTLIHATTSRIGLSSSSPQVW